MGEEVRVGKVIVAMYPGLFERTAGQVGHGVVDAGNGKGGKVGGAVYHHSARQRTGELLSNEGFGRAHFDSPGNCRGVVTPHGGLEVEHGNNLF